MGMYDYFGDEQVKVFYTPIFNSGNKELDENPSTWHSGGSLRYFDEGDVLPLSTWYYKYPNNFMVYDYRFDYVTVFIVKDGTLNKMCSYKELTNDDFIPYVIDNYGNRLDINSVEEFALIKLEFSEAIERDKEVEYNLFPKGLINTIRTNREEFNEKEELWNSVSYKSIKEFNKKWFIKDPYIEEKNFGEALDVYVFYRDIFKTHADDEEYGSYFLDTYGNDFEDCKIYFKKLIETDPSILEKYKKWLDNELILDEINLNEILFEIGYKK